MFASKAPPENEVAAAFLEELLQQLASHLSAVDKTIRYRSCQLLQHLLSGLPDHVFLDESVAATLRQQLAERLQDRLVAVRTEAVRCICHLIDDSQVRTCSNGHNTILTAHALSQLCESAVRCSSRYITDRSL